MQLPRRADDLFLQLGEFAGLFSTAAAALLLLARIHVLAFAKDLIERAHLGEIHVAAGPPQFTVGAGVLGPSIPGNQVVRFGTNFLELQQVGKGTLLFCGHAASEFNRLRFAAADRVREAIGRRAEIVPHGAVKTNLLQR